MLGWASRMSRPTKRRHETFVDRRLGTIQCVLIRGGRLRSYDIHTTVTICLPSEDELRHTTDSLSALRQPDITELVVRGACDDIKSMVSVVISDC